MILVAPYWLMLLELSVASLICLPILRNLLTQVPPYRVHKEPHIFRLHVWLLSSKICGCKAFLKSLPFESQSLNEI